MSVKIYECFIVSSLMFSDLLIPVLFILLYSPIITTRLYINHCALLAFSPNYLKKLENFHIAKFRVLLHLISIFLLRLVLSL